MRAGAGAGCGGSAHSDGEVIAIENGSEPAAGYSREADRTSTATGPRGSSWMRAVHWVAGSGLYKPQRHRSHGPRSFGVRTVRVAQEPAELLRCRPGIGYLVLAEHFALIYAPG